MFRLRRCWCWRWRGPRWHDESVQNGSIILVPAVVSRARTRLYAAKTLAELAKNDDNKSQIIAEGGLVPLIVWARGFGNIEVQEAACEALKRLGVDASLLASKEDVQEVRLPTGQAECGWPDESG